MDEPVNVERLRAAMTRVQAAIADAKADFPDMWNEAIEAEEPPQEWGEIEVAALASDLEDIIAQLALAASLLEAGYAYREMVKGPTPVSPGINSFTLGNALLRAAEALPPRDGGQADG